MKEAYSVISSCCRFAVVVTHAEPFPHNLLAYEHCPSFCLQSSSCGFFVALNLVVSVSVTTATQRQLERHMVFSIFTTKQSNYYKTAMCVARVNL